MPIAEGAAPLLGVELALDAPIGDEPDERNGGIHGDGQLQSGHDTETHVRGDRLRGHGSAGRPRLLHAQAPAALLDTQKLVFENALVRVIEVRVPAGVAERVHTHARGVTVALTDYDNETRAPGAQRSKSRTKFGEVKWAEPVTHEARNVGTTEQRVIRIELK